MHRSKIAGLYLASLFVATGSVAQESGALLSLLPSDPNGFVRAVQQKLSDADLYAGRISGTLTKSTIAAINAACRDADVLADCQLGPLTPKGSAAVAVALNKLSAEPAVAETAPPPGLAPPQAVAEPPATPEPPVEKPAPASAPALAIGAADWSAPPSYGLTATPTVSDKAVSFEIAGTAAGRGWLNVNAGKHIAAVPGSTWSATVTADFSAPEGATATLRIAAQRADGSYITELAKTGAPISGSGTFDVSGKTPPDTAFILPYIQLTYPTGTEASGTLELTDTSVTGPA